jgi:hypothetical protein
VGLNLQRAASACVLLEPPWNPAVLEQRISRIHRPGQRQPVDVVHLVSEGSFETRLEHTILNKRTLAHTVLDGDADEITVSRGLLAALPVPSEHELGAAEEEEETLEVVTVKASPDLTEVSTPREAQSPVSVALVPVPRVSAPLALEPRPDGRFNVILTAAQAAQLARILSEPEPREPRAA